MRIFFTLWRRELASYFLSPIAYLTLIFFLLFMGTGFVLLIMALSNGLPAVSVMRAIYGDSLFTWIGLIGMVPVITMRLIAEEKRNGTLETLMTVPVSETALILAKYAGAMTFYLALWMPTLAYPIVLSHISENSVLEPAVLGTSILGLTLLGMFFVSIGLFSSVLTRNQIVAAIMSFSLMGTFLFVGLFPYHARNPILQEIGRYIFSIDHMREFSWGILDTRPVVLYLTCTAFMILASIRIMQAQRS